MLYDYLSHGCCVIIGCMLSNIVACYILLVTTLQNKDIQIYNQRTMVESGFSKVSVLRDGWPQK